MIPQVSKQDMAMLMAYMGNTPYKVNSRKRGGYANMYEGGGPFQKMTEALSGAEGMQTFGAVSAGAEVLGNTLAPLSVDENANTESASWQDYNFGADQTIEQAAKKDKRVAGIEAGLDAVSTVGAIAPFPGSKVVSLGAKIVKPFVKLGAKLFGKKASDQDLTDEYLSLRSTDAQKSLKSIYSTAGDMNYAEEGGYLPSEASLNEGTIEGPSHEQGGVFLGMGANGKPNVAEGEEYIVKIGPGEGQEFIFTNNPNREGIPYSDMARKIEKKYPESNSGIEMDTRQEAFDDLAADQEQYKQEMEQEQQAAAGANQFAVGGYPKTDNGANSNTFEVGGPIDPWDPYNLMGGSAMDLMRTHQPGESRATAAAQTRTPMSLEEQEERMNKDSLFLAGEQMNIERNNSIADSNFMNIVDDSVAAQDPTLPPINAVDMGSSYIDPATGLPAKKPVEPNLAAMFSNVSSSDGGQINVVTGERSGLSNAEKVALAAQKKAQEEADQQARWERNNKIFNIASGASNIGANLVNLLRTKDPKRIDPIQVNPSIKPMFFDSTSPQRRVQENLATSLYNLRESGADLATLSQGVNKVNQGANATMGAIMTEGQKLNMAMQKNIDDKFTDANIRNVAAGNQADIDQAQRQDNIDSVRRTYISAIGTNAGNMFKDMADSELSKSMGTQYEYLAKLLQKNA